MNRKIWILGFDFTANLVDFTKLFIELTSPVYSGINSAFSSVCWA